MNNILTIVITYNAIKWAERCFGSLESSKIKTDVYVIDNGSSDGTQDYILKHYPNVILKQSDSNIGFGKANNIGLQYALDNGYDYVYLLNQDAWIFPNTLEELIRLSKQYPEYGILSPMQMEADLRNIDNAFLGAISGSKNGKKIFSDFYNETIDSVYSVNGVMAAHWFITRECIERVGGFSPTFPHYGEDDNFNERTLYHGFKIGIVPTLKVVHDRGCRPTPRDKQLYLVYTGMLKEISSPINNRRFSMTIYLMITSLLKYCSVKPIWDFSIILLNYRTIKKNRDESITQKCCFLKEP